MVLFVVDHCQNGQTFAHLWLTWESSHCNSSMKMWATFQLVVARNITVLQRQNIFEKLEWPKFL